jgi:hypothetical protein
MIGQLYINDKDVFATWGAYLEDGSENALLLPAPNKEYASNKARSQHGKQVFRSSPRKDERDIILYFCLAASTRDEFLTKYEAFTEELDTGMVTMRVPSLKKVYKLDAISYQDLGFYDCTGKFAVKFNEPNPKDRILL